MPLETGTWDACLCEQYHWETGPDLLDDPVQLFLRGLAARVKVEHELWVQREVGVHEPRKDVVGERCNEGGECRELLRWGERERRTWRGHRLDLAMGGYALLAGETVLCMAAVVLYVCEEGLGEVHGGVGNEEEVAGKGEEGEEGEEGGAVLYTVLQAHGGAGGEEEGHGWGAN